MLDRGVKSFKRHLASWPAGKDGNAMKRPVGAFLERLRGLRSRRAPASAPGWTVFDDVAIRLRNLTVEGIDASQGDPGSDPGVFKIRIAGSRDHQEGAGSLVERRYAWRGYDIQQKPADPHLFTFVAYDEGQVVGTVSIRLDSDRGLSADERYKQELDALRTAGCRLCEFTRLAVDTHAISKVVLAGLFHTAYMFAYQLRGHDNAVIEVNPRHAAFYRRALIFEPCGGQRLNARVNAPAVLLRLPFDRVPPQLEKYGGRPELAKTTRLMYANFFGAKEAGGILERLRRLDQGEPTWAPELRDLNHKQVK